MNSNRDPQEGDLLHHLVETAREVEAEDARFDERWDRLAIGELDEAETAALAEESTVAHELFQPLGNDFHDQVVSALRTQPGGGAAVPTEEKTKVLPFRRRAPYLGGLLAAAALFLLILGRPNEPAPLPEYRAELLGSAQEVRSGDGVPREVPLFLPGNAFEIVLRPDAAVDGAVDVSCFLDRDGTLRPWDVPAEISDRGAVRILGTLGQDLVVESGRFTLHLTVGRPGTLPDLDALREHLESPMAQPWELLSVPFEVGSPRRSRGGDESPGGGVPGLEAVAEDHPLIDR